MNKKITVLTLVYVLLMSPFCFLLLTESLQTVSAQEPEVTIPYQYHMIAESIGDPETVDPAWAYDTASTELIFNVYETLIQFDFESVENFVPCLATEWIVSPDGLTYTFTIRDNVKFHDGSIMTVEDVEYSFEHILVQDRSGGPGWMFYEPLFGRYHADMSWPEDETCPINTAIEAVGNQIVFHLAMSYPPFLQILSQSWASILNKDLCIANYDWPGTWNNWKDYHNPPTAPLDVAGNVMCGTGPYMLDYWTHGVEWSIVKFDDYWQGWPAPHCSRFTERATVKVVYEWETRLADFRAGTADMVHVPRAYIAQVEGYPGIRGIKDLPTLSVDAAFFNFDITTPSPYIGSGALDGNGIPPDFFSDIHVRKAFAYAFDHTQYISAIFNNEAETPPAPHIRGLPYSTAVWNGVVNPHYGYLAPVPTHYIDLAKVKSELKLAFGGAVWNKGFKMSIAYNAGNVPRMTAAMMFKETLESLNSDPTFGGCTIDTIAVTWSTYLGEILYYPTFRSVLPFYIMGWSADYPDAHNFVMPFQHSEGELAYPSSYSNPTVNALVEAGIAETDPIEREYIYWQIGWEYYNDVPGICLAQPLGRHWERDWVQGWYYNIARGGSLTATTGCVSTTGLYFYHLWKGLDGDINGDNSVDIWDLLKLNAYWYDPHVPGPPIEGPLGYNRIADIYPYLQYQGDLDPASWLPLGEPSVGCVDIYDWAVINEHWGEWAYPVQPRPCIPSEATLFVDPPETVTTDPFFVDIMVDDVANMFGYQFNLVYDTSVLTATAFVSWSPFDNPLLGAIGGEINDAEGYVKMAFSYPWGEHYGLTTPVPFPVASIAFDVEGPGASPLQIEDSMIAGIYGDCLAHLTMCGEFRTGLGLPLAKFTWTPEAPFINELVTFTSLSTDLDGFIVSWDWDFGDGNVGTGELATNTYFEPDEYTVALTVIDSDGNTDSHSDIITIRERPACIKAEELIETVETWNLPEGTEKSLTSKLEDAIKSLNKGNENGAKHKLMDLIDKAEAMRGKRLTNEQADHIISEAERIIDLI